MQRAFSHLPLRYQIFSLVVLAGLVVAACAVSVWLALGNLERAEIRRDREAVIASQAALLDAALLGARRNERDFLEHRDTKYAVRHDETVAEAIASLDAIAASLLENDGRRGQVATIRQGVTSYNTDFHKLIILATAIGQDDKDGLLGSMRIAGRDAELSLKAQDDLRPLVALLAMRRDEAGFLTHHESLYAERFAADAKELADLLPYATIADEARPLIVQRIAAYRRAFQVASQAVLTAAATADGMGDTYTAIAPAIRELVLGAQLRMATAGSVADHVQVVTDVTLAVTLAAGLLLVLGLGTLIARSIWRPLTALTEAMHALAEGRLDVAIPSAERRDEVSRMAHALTVFRGAMAEAERARRIADSERRRSEAEKLAALEALAYLDGLTGLPNRRHFDQTITVETERALDKGHALSLVMVDIDNFKRVNDTYGHAVGDAVLCHVARLLREEARRTDVPARYGGEEFAIILPATGRILTRLVAERLRATVEHSPVDLGDGRLAQLTISIGFATLDSGDAPATLAERADRALYRAKENGRNRVEEWHAVMVGESAGAAG